METRVVLFVTFYVFIGFSNICGTLASTNGTIIYPVDCQFKVVKLSSNTTTRVEVTGVELANTSFLVVQVHSQSNCILLSSQPDLVSDENTNTGLLVPLEASLHQPPPVYITNPHPRLLQVLLLVRSYSHQDAVPGGADLPLARPYLLLHSNILTTSVTVPPASHSLPPSSALLPHNESTASNTSSNDTVTERKAPLNNPVSRRPSGHALVAERNIARVQTNDTANTSELGKNSALRSARRRRAGQSNGAYKSSRVITETTTDNGEGARITPVQARSSIPADRAAANATQLLYEVYLSYMYEGDILEDHYWQTVIETSSPQLLDLHATKVASYLTDEYTAPPPYLFVSYSGVGAVVSVQVTNVYLTNTSGSTVVVRAANGSLYSSSVSYGCDFIPDEQHRCTKLVSSLAQILCASLLFVGLVLCFAGHRWLNFTMFTAGFLGSWFTLFVTFVHVPHVDIDGLALGTFQYSVVCGVLWLMLWHKLKRPFVSALLIILEAGLLTAMTTTHFLKYALVPTPSNVAVFVVLPVLFALCLVAYSFRNIKTVHILACVLVGSYATTMPLSFYFGCSLNYIVINAVAAMTVPGYTAAVGFPPFQTCDIVLLTLWLTLLTISLAYQHVRERHSPPFPPPNLQYWRAARRSCSFLYEQSSVCCCRILGRAPDTRSGRYSNLNTTEERVAENGAAGPECVTENGIGTQEQDETRFLAPNIRANLNSLKIWIGSGMGLRNRTPFPAYHSFPRHPDESDDRERAEEIQDDGCTPPMGAPTPGVGSRTAKVWSDLKDNFLQRIRPHMLWRRTTLVEDCPDDAVSSGSSDGEVDRRAVGIFGDVETPGRESDSEERRLSEASDRDLADLRGESFKSSQLTFDHL
ncbi:protein of unknown function DUF4203 [Trinorchestia longiramus]|nr:protein of unknown function DUF4203 [Trinorchestia longiramus]